MTWAMPFTSNPLLATSVATSICRQCTAAQQKRFSPSREHMSSPMLIKGSYACSSGCTPMFLPGSATASQGQGTASKNVGCTHGGTSIKILSQKMQKLPTVISKAHCKVAETLMLTRTSPLVKSLRAPSRSHCDKPPCKASALSPSVRSNSATSSHRALRSTKMMVRGICCPLLSACRDSSSSTAATSSSF